MYQCLTLQFLGYRITRLKEILLLWEPFRLIARPIEQRSIEKTKHSKATAEHFDVYYTFAQ